MENNLQASDLLDKLNQALMKGSAQDISRAVQNILQTSVDCSVLQGAINILEPWLFNSNAYYLAKFLFLLYDKSGNDCMARFYLQYCYEELSTQSAYISTINKYLSLTPRAMKSKYFTHDGDFSYIFEGQEKKYGIHSFSNEIGHNLTLLITPYGSLILDCGAKCSSGEQAYISRSDLVSFLTVYGVTIDEVVGVLISHAHLDHYGSISSLLDVGISPLRFYADERTKKIIRDATGERNIEGARPISSFFVANQKIQIHSYDNGHILGSQLFVIRFDDKTVVFTGDFCLHSQQTVPGLDLPKLCEDEFVAAGIDCLVTESTYGNNVSNILPYQDAESALLLIIDKLICNGYKVFLPAFAVGRSQELTILLSQKYRLLIDGLSIKLTQTYERLLDSKIATSNVKYSTGNNSKVDNFDFNDIIIASSGMISENSTSAKYIEELFDSKQRVAIIRTGYLDSSEESYGYSILQGWKKQGGLLFDVSLSAHASYDELFSLINTLAPSNVIAIHGSGITHTEWDETENDTEPSSCENNSFDEDTSTNSSFIISDPLVLNRWKNAVKIGASIISSGKALESSTSFQTAFKLLIKSLKSSVNNESILQKMNECDSIDTLFAFLKSVLELNTPVTEAETIDAIEAPHSNLKEYRLIDIADIFWGEKIIGKDRLIAGSTCKILRPKHIIENKIHFEKRGEYCCSQEWLEQNGKTHRAMVQLGDIIVRATGRNNYAVVNQELGTVVAGHNVLVIRAKPGCKKMLSQVISSSDWDSIFSKDRSIDVEMLSALVFCIDGEPEVVEPVTKTTFQPTHTNKETMRTDVVIPPVKKSSPEWSASSTLYVHKGTIRCQRESHDVIQATAVLVGRNESNIQLSVNYCRDCDKFFINYVSYEEYRKRYGFLIGNIILDDEGKPLYGDIALAEASPLKLCGYSVNQQDDFSRETRRYIIRKIISLGVMSKSEVIRYLEYFITMNGKRRGNEIAVSKWKDDLAYTLSIDFENQSKFNITKIARY